MQCPYLHTSALAQDKKLLDVHSLWNSNNDNSYEYDRCCWFRCDAYEYCLITTHINWFSSLNFVSQFFFSADFWHC